MFRVQRGAWTVSAWLYLCMACTGMMCAVAKPVLLPAPAHAAGNKLMSGTDLCVGGAF